jgi:hypothetical protein
MFSPQPLLGPTFNIPNACPTRSSSRHRWGETAPRGGTIGVKSFHSRDIGSLRNSFKALVAAPGHEHQGLQALRVLQVGSFGGGSNGDVNAHSTRHRPCAKEPRLPCAATQHDADQPSWWHVVRSIVASCAIASVFVAGGPCSRAEARARLTQVSLPSISS